MGKPTRSRLDAVTAMLHAPSGSGPQRTAAAYALAYHEKRTRSRARFRGMRGAYPLLNVVPARGFRCGE